MIARPATRLDHPLPSVFEDFAAAVEQPQHHMAVVGDRAVGPQFATAELRGGSVEVYENFDVAPA